jgi:hypothetical protein
VDKVLTLKVVEMVLKVVVLGVEQRQLEDQFYLQEALTQLTLQQKEVVVRELLQI